MPATVPTKFFDTYRPWQWIKHQILGEYITRWSRMVGSFAPSIHIVDTFAGAGHYDGPDGHRLEGSPIIEARACAVYNAQFASRKHRMDLFCIERDPKVFAKLVEALAPFGDVVRARRGDFFAHVPELLHLITSDPALILFDPIGLKPITADRCRPLLARAGKTDLLVVVDFQIVHRTGGQLLASGEPNPKYKTAVALTANIDAFFSTKDWRKIAVNPKLSAQARERQYLNLYAGHVLGSGYTFRCAYPVRARHQGSPEYWIVNSSNNVKALWLMNDCIAGVDPKLMEKTLTAPDQLPGFLTVTLEAYREDIEHQAQAAMIGAIHKAGGTAPFSELCQKMLGEFFGRLSESAYARLVKKLVKDGAVTREQRPAAKLLPTEQLSLPAVN